MCESEIHSCILPLLHTAHMNTSTLRCLCFSVSPEEGLVYGSITEVVIDVCR